MVIECVISNRGVVDEWTCSRVISSERSGTVRRVRMESLFPLLKRSCTADSVISH